MKPVNYTVRIYQNAAWKLQATFKGSDNTIFDLSAYDGELVIRRSVANPDAIFRGTVAAGNISFAGAVANNITLSLTATQTDELETANYEQLDWVYEFIMWDAADKDNTAVRLLQGNCEVYPSVARVDGT